MGVDSTEPHYNCKPVQTSTEPHYNWGKKAGFIPLNFWVIPPLNRLPDDCHKNPK